MRKEQKEERDRQQKALEAEKLQKQQDDDTEERDKPVDSEVEPKPEEAKDEGKKEPEKSDDDKIEEELKFVPTLMRCPLLRFNAALVTLEISTKEFWMAQAHKHVASVVTLVRMPPNMAHAEKLRRLKAAPLISTPTNFGNLGFYYDYKQDGETWTNPNVRFANLKENLYVRLANAIMEARHGPGEAYLHDKEMFIGLDPTGTPAMTKKLMKPWLPKALQKEQDNKNITPRKKDKDDLDVDDESSENKEDGDAVVEGNEKKQAQPEYIPKTITAFKTEISLRARRGLGHMKKGANTLTGQVEQMHCLTKSWKCCPERQSRAYEGQSNVGVIRGPLEMEAFANDWKLNVGQKRLLYGSSGRSGGESSAASERRPVRPDDQIELAFWHAMPTGHFTELKWRHYLGEGGFVDLACANGASAKVAFDDRHPFV